MEGSDHPTGALPEYVYWRRRAIASVAVLLAVGLIAWSCAGSGDEGRKNAGARQPAAAGPSGTRGPAAHAPLPAPTVTVTSLPGPSGATSRSESASPAATRTGPAAARKRRACGASDLRVALTSGADAYAGDHRPRFAVLVTSGRGCVVDLGPKRLRLTITSGTDRIWSSADCARAGRDTTRKVSPHRPYRKVVTWHRTRSDPDQCGDGGTPATARPGWYVAVATLGKVHSRKVVFRLTS